MALSLFKGLFTPTRAHYPSEGSEMNNSRLRSAIAIVKQLVAATDREKSYVVEHLSPEEIKSLCELVSSIPRASVKRKPRQAALVKKHGGIVRKLRRAKNKKDYRKVGAGIKKIGGGIFTALLLSLLGEVLPR